MIGSYEINHYLLEYLLLKCKVEWLPRPLHTGPASQRSLSLFVPLRQQMKSEVTLKVCLKDD